MAGERFRRLLVPEVSMETSFTWQPSYVRPLEATLPKDLHGKEQVVRRYDRTMLALGNTDTKAAVLVYGLSSTPRNGQKIRDDLEAVLPADTWLPSATTLRLKYLRDGFCPTGIATEFDNSGRYFYATTTEGEGLPKDIAAFNLHYAANTNRSISSIFGNTTTPEDSGVRSYINRTALLLLLSRGQTYVSEIIRQTGMGTSTTGGNLAKLRDLGFVDYEFADTEVQGWGVYEKVGIPDQIVHSPINDRLRRNILEYYRLNTIGNPQTIIKALGRVDTIDVFQILSELVDAGFLKRSQWYGGVQQSDAKITAEGKRFVEEFILPILYTCADDPVYTSQLTAIRRKVEADPQIAARVIDIQKLEDKRIPRSETIEAIITYIRKHGPTRPKEILSVFGIRAEPILGDLAHSGSLVTQRDGRASYYMVPDMKRPEGQKTTIIYEYIPPEPENLVPPTCLPKEAYRAALETKKFWKGLAVDLATIVPGTITDRYFFYSYNPNNPNWQQKDDYRIGKYQNLVLALRRLGIRNPYQYIREFRPVEQDKELQLAVIQVQAAIRDRLIESQQMKQWSEYVDDLHSEAFWKRFASDVAAAPSGITMGQFLNHYTEGHPKHFDPTTLGKYANLYAELRSHTENGTNYLRDFIPTLPHQTKLERLVQRTQRMLREKFVFHTPRRKPEHWIEAITTSVFWDEFKSDLLQYTGNTTFRNFLFFFDENNRDVQKRRTQDGKWYLGKYYKILDTLSSHAARFLELPEMADLPKSLYPGEIARWFIYRNAPMDVRDILLTTFPAEFRPIDDACIHRMETDSPTRLAEVLPIISLQGNLRRIISTIDLLAGTSLKDKMAILAFTFWQEDPSRENIELASQLLNVGPREVYRYVDSIIDEDRLEQVWDRYIDLQENLEKANRQPSNVS